MSNCHIIIGGDYVLVAQKRQALLAQAGENTERYRCSLSTKADWPLLQEKAVQHSLFASKKMFDVRIENTQLFTGSLLDDWFASMSKEDTVVFSLFSNTPSKRLKQQVWLKKLQKYCKLHECQPINQHTLKQWVVDELGRYQLTIADDALHFLCYNLTNNLVMAKQVTDKLAILKDTIENNRVNMDNIRQLVKYESIFGYYEIINPLLAGQATLALRILNTLQQQRVDVLPVFMGIAREVQNLVALIWYRRHHQLADANRKLGLWPARQQRLLAAMQRLGEQKVLSIHRQCQQLDSLIKGLGSGDSWLEFQTIVEQLVGIQVRNKTTTLTSHANINAY